jgi:hypothetical protein
MGTARAPANHQTRQEFRKLMDVQERIFVIASEAKQSSSCGDEGLDCFVAFGSSQ